MKVRYRIQGQERELDAVAFDDEPIHSNGADQVSRYEWVETTIDELDIVDREAVALKILKRWYKNVVATNASLKDYSRDNDNEEYAAEVQSTADDIIEYAKELLKEGPFGGRDRERVYERVNEDVDTAFNRLDNLDVLRHTNNEDAIDMHGMDVDKKNPVQSIAYWAFYQDVWDAVNEAIDLTKRDLGLDIEEEEPESEGDADDDDDE